MKPASDINELTESYPIRLWLDFYAPIASVIVCDKNDCIIYTYTHKYKKSNKLLIKKDTLKNYALYIDSLIQTIKREWKDYDILDGSVYRFDRIKNEIIESASYSFNENDEKMVNTIKNIAILFDIQTIQSEFLRKLPKGKYHNFGHIYLIR